MKIVAIGDSITEGYPFSHDDSWVAYVAKELKIEIVNKGVCGDLTQGMRERFKRDVFSDNPTHVIILGGANDALTGFSPDCVSANIKAMIEMSQHQGIIPIVGLPLPFLLIKEEMLMSQYRDWLKHYINRENIMFIDFWAPFFTAVQEGRVEKLYVDEVHPSIEGYKLMGETALHSLVGLVAPH
ncbi:GDSL-type esterase/lipase family protein [Desulfosporosinus sp. BG]|uniref:GDSL-type esterase/lipase family protein n=1 Tax=Desulfosporosinus sp. BG TaxID=1633135 RepID=UPI000855A467|nr:GDSL-type esterase/lipase family protein [Desulfosporosinus sp. BG]ODA41888.1 putative tesA-like protease [Desulfosporosinus sp. BG]